MLTFAWAIANPPFAAPDEWAHYLRAIGLSEGHLLGRPARYEPPGTSPAQIRWLDYAARSVYVPRGLAPDSAGCNVTQPRESAACLNHASIPAAGPRVDSVGNYQPFPYVAPALLVRLGNSWRSADHWARVGAALLPLACLAWAAFLLLDAGGAALAGLAIGVTPMTLFVSSTVQPSGLEIASAVLFAVALIRLDDHGDAAGWFAVGASGLLLALSRSPGPVWIVLLLCLALILMGPRRLGARFRAGGIAAKLAVAATAGGIILNRIWEGVWGAPVTVSLRPFPQSVIDSAQQLPRVLHEEVGVFDYLEWHLPAEFYWGWFAAIALLVVLALLAGETRERVAVLASLVLAAVVPIALYALVTRHTGFGIQGRHVLPIGAALPIIAGAVVARRRHRLPRGALLAVRVLLPMAAAGQMFAWLDNSHRQAVGVGGRDLFPLGAQWAPPLGWWPWIAVALVGSASMAAAALISARSEPAAEHVRAQSQVARS